MIEIGETLEIGGKQGIVCYETRHDDANYICVAFKEEKLRYELYEYKFENSKLLVGKVEDPEEAKEVIKIFIDECIEENGFPEELKKLLDYVDRKKKKTKED